MKIMVMKRSGKRLLMSDRRAVIFQKMGVAFEDSQPVKKRPLPQIKSIFETLMDAAEEAGEKGICVADVLGNEKPKRRRYRRRDMEAEENAYNPRKRANS